MSTVVPTPMRWRLGFQEPADLALPRSGANLNLGDCSVRFEDDQLYRVKYRDQTTRSHQIRDLLLDRTTALLHLILDEVAVCALIDRKVQLVCRLTRRRIQGSEEWQSRRLGPPSLRGRAS